MITNLLRQLIGQVPVGFEYMEYTFVGIVGTILIFETLNWFRLLISIISKRWE